MLTHSDLSLVGTKVINNRQVPVYRHANGRRFVQVTDQTTGKPLLLGLDGAKALKNGQYPLHPDLKPVVLSELVNDEVPFALRSEKEQVETTQRLLRAFMGRIIASGVDFKFLEN